MICSKCGAQNMDGVTFCGSCGMQMVSQNQPQVPIFPQNQQNNENRTHSLPRQNMSSLYTVPEGGPLNGGIILPKDYLIESIIVTIASFLCCCGSPISIILGIIAIVKANSVKSLYENDNIDKAFRNANVAKTLSIWAAIISVIFVIAVYFVFIAAMISEAGGLIELLYSLLFSFS